jgi:hypothetical protein
MSLRSPIIFGLGICWFVVGALAYEPAPASYLAENFGLFQQICHAAMLAFLFVGFMFFLYDLAVYVRRRAKS